MKKLFYSFLILFSFYITYAQNLKQSDSFHQTEKQITDRYDKIEMDDEEEANIDEIKKLCEQSKKLNFSEGILRGLMIQQQVAATQKNYTLSAKYGNEAEIIAEQVQNYKALSKISKLRGYVDMILDKYPEAEIHLKTSIGYAEKIENKADRHMALCGIYMNLAGMYEGLEKPEKALESLKKSLQYIETVPVNNLTEYQRDTYYYLYINGLQSMGGYYIVRKPQDLDHAEFYLKKVLDFQNTAPKYFEGQETSVYRSLCGLYFEKGDYQKSLDYSFKFLEAEKKQKDPVARLWVYNKMKDDYKFLKNNNEEIKYMRLSTALNDSLNFAEKKAIISLSRDQIKKSDNRNSLFLEKIIVGSASVILVIIIGFWILINKKNKRHRKKYDELIAKINSKKDTVPPSMTPDKVENNNTRPTIVPDETAKALLQKLEKFEASEKYLKKEANLTWLAHNLSTNTKYLSEIIRIYRGKNFSNYINGLRINYIVHKLYNEPKYRDYKISHLVEESGFVTYKVFVIAFKNEHGVTPSYFIEKLKQENL
ncbi:AraC family transcriptional regulator [Epilithonimonas sp.]|uniref:AraC family transcriptional regulator n=1 Tax=Epilithonimonas sp. TaxID=2894511 RepID=UPI00289D4C2C|nr:AraC family transcriptional regulator [Epilithonimonas sp.]